MTFRGGAVVGVLPFLLGAPVRAEPGSAETANDSLYAVVSECSAEHDSAQMARLDERWADARQALTRCADDRCPVAIRSDCRSWLDDLMKALPSVLVSVERDDAGAEPVVVELNGVRRILTEPTAIFEVFPGEQHLRFLLPAHAPIDRRIVVQKGQKNVLVQVRFNRPAPVIVPRKSEPSAFVPRPVPRAVYWYSASGLAAFAVSGAVLASALSSLDDAERTCSPECGSRKRDSIRARLVLADISAGAGIVLSGLAAWTYITRPGTAPERSLRAGIRVSERGPSIVLDGTL